MRFKLATFHTIKKKRNQLGQQTLLGVDVHIPKRKRKLYKISFHKKL